MLHVGQNAVHISADGTDAATALKKLLQQHSTLSKALANLFVANIDTTKVTSKLHVFPAWIPSLALAQVIRSTVIIV